MSCDIDWPSWITAISAAVTTFVVFGSWRISKRLLSLQAGQLKIQDTQAQIQAEQLNIEQKAAEGASPLIHIWYNRHQLSGNSMIGVFTLLNTGGSPLAIRTLRILSGSVNQGQALEIAAHAVKDEKSVAVGRTSSKQELVDLVIVPNELTKVEMRLEASQVRFEVMYYDNSFEFVEIDTSILGGKYRLTGRGKKP